MTDWELASRTNHKELVRVARGSYLDETEYRELDAAGRHRALLYAVAHRSGDHVVFSHQSAAVLHGFGLWDAPLRNVHLTNGDTGHGSIRNRVHRHCERLPPGDVVSIGGLQLTCPARTVADLACVVSLHSAVVTGDHAIRLGLDPEDLDIAVAAAKGRRGAAKARLAASLMDGRSESVGESLSRLKIRELKLPNPELQSTCGAHRAKNSDEPISTFPGTLWSASSTARSSTENTSGPANSPVMRSTWRSSARTASATLVSWSFAGAGPIYSTRSSFVFGYSRPSSVVGERSC